MAPQITIREATTADMFGLRKLAALDDRPALRGTALVAEENGEIRAAIELNTGRVIANPFARTSDLVELLELQRGHLAQPVAA